MSSIQAIRGTRDILPSESPLWVVIEGIARQVLSQSAYREIRTPIFEMSELFARGIGEATDAVGKEMYSFEDRGGRSIALRPEITAGLVRAFIQNKLFAQGGVQRLWHLGPAFRYERPQAGRQRQFHQLDVEILGSRDARADVEIIAIATQILNTLGLKALSLDLNSVGSGEDRRNYRDALVAYFTPYKLELDTDSRDRLDRNPLRILDSKDKRTQEIVTDAPSLLDFLSDDSRRHFDAVQQHLTNIGIDFTINPRLVRGLDYYTHTAFEIQSSDLGAQATVCGGGRYDGLVAQLGGPDTPAIGFGMGMERLVILLEQMGQYTTEPLLDIYLISRGKKAELQSVKLAHQLRQNGYSVEVDLSGSAFGKQFKRADRSGAVLGLILGDAEVDAQKVQLKWLGSNEQSELTQAELVKKMDEIKSKIAAVRAQSTL
ncbi:histidyl-tRNA synthetase [Synechococcus sp. PCC 7335]|uniref:histidine--tRNA ligase n=1 Tax=Synechococcus sp. (strain ATCC 29403 / PCC 7335) TaxID=91464 RepID=UPI00017ECEE7|nr:histidine--tRNA ligase [Synechococcus sp. PCC 7335]EDX87846.1 histidyl-tRNA synthetase [Synechococcus sp. PCC 7335]